jgi:hypothetical protein
MKKNDKERVLELLEEFNMPYKHYKEKMYVMKRARITGAVEVISVMDGLDFNFNKMGRMVGASTSQIDSFVPREA